MLIGVVTILFLLTVMSFIFAEDSYYRWVSIIFFIIGLICLFGVVVGWYDLYAESQTTIKELTEELSKKNSEIDGLYDELEYYKGDNQ